MAFRELSVVEIREILRRWSRGDSLRAVAAATASDRKTVRRYVEAAKAAGFGRGDAVSEPLLDVVVEAVLPGAPVRVGPMRQHCRDHSGLIEGWVREGVKGPKIVRLLHRHTGIMVPRRTLRRFIDEELGKARQAGATVRIVDPPPGQVVEIDFMTIGRFTLDGEERVVHALVVVAARSRHLFVWVCLTQKREDVIEGLDAAWRFFGGIFPVVVADNPKAIVTKTDPLAPVFNEEMAEYAQTRGFVFDQARVRRPQDKPRVERAVPYVRKDGFGGERFVDVEQMQSHIERWCRDVAGQRCHGTTRQKPLESFEKEERPLLLPAPTKAYNTPRWVDLLVGRDHAVSIAEALYSVPYRLRGERLRVRVDRDTVKLYHQRRVVKVHTRVPRGGSQIDPSDLPPGTAELATRDAEGLQARAAKAGPAVGEYAKRVLAGPLPWTRMRHVYRLLGLCRRFGNHRVDRACQMALDLDVVEVVRIARMLERELDGAPPLPSPPAAAKVIRPRFGRDPSTYALAKREPHE